jgi:predicted exporter
MADYPNLQALARLRGQIGALGRRYLPAEVALAVTGTSVLWANTDVDLIRTQPTSLTVAASVLAVLLPLVFRSWRLGVLGIVVSFLPIACTLGLMAWFGVKVNRAACLIGAIAVGVAVDDTIYFPARVKTAPERGRSLHQAVRRGMLVVGAAMSTTSLIPMAGILTIATSDLVPSTSFGVLFAVTVGLATLGDLLLAPVLLRGWEGLGVDTASGSPPHAQMARRLRSEAPRGADTDVIESLVFAAHYPLVRHMVVKDGDRGAATQLVTDLGAETGQQSDAVAAVAVLGAADRILVQRTVVDGDADQRIGEPAIRFEHLEAQSGVSNAGVAGKIQGRAQMGAGGTEEIQRGETHLEVEINTVFVLVCGESAVVDNNADGKDTVRRRRGCSPCGRDLKDHTASQREKGCPGGKRGGVCHCAS